MYTDFIYVNSSKFLWNIRENFLNKFLENWSCFGNSFQYRFSIVTNIYIHIYIIYVNYSTLLGNMRNFFLNSFEKNGVVFVITT